MKRLLCILAALLATTTFAQPQIVPLGTNYIAGSSTLAFPIVYGTTLNTNGVIAWYTNTQTVISTNRFTLPTTNTVYTTNSFSRSNSVAYPNVLSWSVLESVYATNSEPFYVTNVYATTNNQFGKSGTIITTNYQFANFSTPVTYSITGTVYTVTTNTSYGPRVLIDASKAQSLGIQFSGSLSNAGTTALGLAWGYGITGTNNPGAWSMSHTPAGATWVATMSNNVPVAGIGFYELLYITNGNTAPFTNPALWKLTK